MLNARFRPIQKWPGTPTPPAKRRKSDFKAEYIATLDLLEYELARLGARNITIQCQCRLDQIRNDGQLNQATKLEGPAVLVSFTSGVDEHQYSYPCDTFTEFKDNLRAIALALVALRKIDRYGVTRRGEQYQGFRELPPGPQTRPKMSPHQAATAIAAQVPGIAPEALVSDKLLFESILKVASIKHHPDKGGSHDIFVQLQEAGAVLSEHFKELEKGAAGGAG